MNVHIDCQEKAPKCEAKARLLRRQKSTSEIETRIPDAAPEEESKWILFLSHFLSQYIRLASLIVFIPTITTAIRTES